MPHTTLVAGFAYVQALHDHSLAEEGAAAAAAEAEAAMGFDECVGGRASDCVD